MRLFVVSFLLVCSCVFGDEWKGAEYSKHSSIQKSHADLLIERLPLIGNEKILDVGCGSGEITKKFASRVPEGEVVGLDPSKSMLSVAKSNLTLSNLSFVEGCAESFRLDTKFNYAIAIHSLHWVKEQEKALANIALHLEVGGRAFFILAPSKEGLPFHTALSKAVKQSGRELKDFVSNQQAYDLETYRKYMIGAGFSIDEIRYTRYSREFSSPDSLIEWIIQWLPHYKALSTQSQELFSSELLENYLLERGYSVGYDGPVLWEEYVLFVEATRVEK